MISADLLSEYYTLNYRVIHRQIEGLSHEDSLLQPPFRGNCLNWVLGHIVAGRSSALRLLGQDPVWKDEESARYRRESDPITDPAEAFRLERIVADLDLSQERLTAALERLLPEDLERVEGNGTLGERLAFAYWHEAYHSGQTELLRQLAGTDDKVI